MYQYVLRVGLGSRENKKRTRADAAGLVYSPKMFYFVYAYRYKYILSLNREENDVRLYAYTGSMCTYGLHTVHICVRTYLVSTPLYAYIHVCMRKHGVCVDTEDDGV